MAASSFVSLRQNSITNTKYFHMKVICLGYTWINIHVQAISYIIARWPFFNICVTNLRWNRGEMSRFRCTFLFAGLVKNAARAWRPRLQPVSVSCHPTFLGGGEGTWGHLGIFSAKGFCLCGRRTLQSLISPQQLNTQSSIKQGLERQEPTSQSLDSITIRFTIADCAPQ